MKFQSTFEALRPVALPAFSGTRVMMMPLVLGRLDSIPEMLLHYRQTLGQLFSFRPQHDGQVGYVTIDEKTVEAGKTHRRTGLHVDGVFQGRSGSWGGGWGSVGNGMVTVASHVGCRAFAQEVVGEPGFDGECDHLAAQLVNGLDFQAHQAYWVDGLCVHESLPQPTRVDRQFVRLSYPSTAPWFEGYTPNPLGVLPTGDILPPRVFMQD